MKNGADTMKKEERLDEEFDEDEESDELDKEIDGLELDDI